jgi:RNA polymerase sigma-70 factor (ECF subfamily)
MECEEVISIEKFEKNAYKELVSSIKGGNADCLIDWINEKKSKLYKIAWAYLRNHADVEDVFHNTILKVIENSGKLKSEEAFESWFISILMNECRKILRERKRVLSAEEVEFGGGNRNPGEEDCRVDIANGLKNIDEEYKEMIVLKYYSGYSQKEISEIMHVPLGTVKTKIFRGLRALRDVLRRED